MSAFKWTRSILLLHKTTHPIRKFQPVEIFSEFSGWFENGMKSQSLLKTKFPRGSSKKCVSYSESALGLVLFCPLYRGGSMRVQ